MMEAKTMHATETLETVDSKSQAELTKVHTLGEVVLVSDSHVRRVPVPTDDPNDPLNFSKWRKAGIILTCCWFSTFSLLAISGTGAFMQTLIEMYMPTEHSITKIVGLGTYPALMMAFGALGLLPLSFVFGRRPIFLLAVVISLITSLTAGASNTFDSHFTSRIFLGLAGGATESILPLIITDVTFLDERSFYFGLYWAAQNCIDSGILVSLSYMTAAIGWRWFYWLFAITLGVSTMIGFFLLPETRFARSPMAVGGNVVFTDEFGATHILTDREAEARLNGQVYQHVDTGAAKRTYLQTLKPWNKPIPNGLRVWAGAYLKMLQSCSSPMVIFALLASSIALGLGVGGSVIYSTVLIEQFKWQPKNVGLFNAATIPACFFSMAYSGWFADKTNIWLAKRNNGIHKPEHHLINLIIPCFVGIVGVTVFAVCANWPETHSAWGLIVGWALFQFMYTSMFITATALAAEAIPTNPGAAVVVVVGGKNIIGFGAAQGITSMLQKYSYIKTFMVLLGIYIAIFASGIPVYFLNKKWRRAVGRSEKQEETHVDVSVEKSSS